MSDLSYDNVSFPDGAELKVGDWQIFPALNRIARRGKSVSLQNLSMQVLVYLARRPGAVATHDELLDALWPGRIAGQETIHRRIADLRRHLQDDARSPRYIETIHKRGYRLIANVHRPTHSEHRLPGEHRLLRVVGKHLFSVAVSALLVMIIFMTVAR